MGARSGGVNTEKYYKDIFRIQRRISMEQIVTDPSTPGEAQNLIHDQGIVEELEVRKYFLGYPGHPCRCTRNFVTN